MDMQNYTTPFANTGDREEFSINTDPSGKVSLEKGWTELYQLRPEEGGLFILRKVFNQMMKLVSTDTVNWKTQSFPNWIDDKGDGLPFAYPKNAIIKYTNGNIYVSLVNNNTQIPTGANWKLFDITSLDSTVKLTGNQTIAGVKTFSSNIVGNVTGNSGTATKLQTARTINGVSFDGSANITVADNTKFPLDGGNLFGSIRYHNIVAGGWTRGIEGYIQSTSTRACGIGVFGTGDAITNVYIGYGNEPQSSSANGIRVSATGIQVTGNTEITGNLSVSGNLASPSLTGTPTAPTATVGTNTTQIATTAFVKASMLGENQTVQDVTSQRATNTIYTNSTGKTIIVYVQGNNAAVGVSVENKIFFVDQSSQNRATFLVKNGAEYKVTCNNILSWMEMR